MLCNYAVKCHRTSAHLFTHMPETEVISTAIWWAHSYIHFLNLHLVNMEFGRWSLWYWCPSARRHGTGSTMCLCIHWNNLEHKVGILLPSAPHCWQYLYRTTDTPTKTGKWVRNTRHFGTPGRSYSHRITELEGDYKTIESNSLLKAGIQIKADLIDGCPV